MTAKSDLELFRGLMAKAGADTEDVTNFKQLCDYEPPASATLVVQVWPGDRCHFQAAFDQNGNIVDAGQFESL